MVSQALNSHTFETVCCNSPDCHTSLEEEKMVVMVPPSLAGTREDLCLHNSWYLAVCLLQRIRWNIDTHLQQGQELFELKGNTDTRINWMSEEDFRPADLWGSGSPSQKEFYGLLVSLYL